MTSLLAFADPTHIPYGSDWPFAPKEGSWYFAEQLNRYPLTPEQRLAIDRGNAEALFPQLKGF